MDLGGVLSKHIDGIMLCGVRHGIVRLSPHGRMAFAARSYGFRRMVVWLSPHCRMAFAAVEWRKTLRSTGEEYWNWLTAFDVKC